MYEYVDSDFLVYKYAPFFIPQVSLPCCCLFHGTGQHMLWFDARHILTSCAMQQPSMRFAEYSLEYVTKLPKGLPCTLQLIPGACRVFPSRCVRRKVCALQSKGPVQLLRFAEAFCTWQDLEFRDGPLGFTLEGNLVVAVQPNSQVWLPSFLTFIPEVIPASFPFLSCSNQTLVSCGGFPNEFFLLVDSKLVSVYSCFHFLSSLCNCSDN